MRNEQDLKRGASPLSPVIGLPTGSTTWGSPGAGEIVEPEQAIEAEIRLNSV
jgi:hypothetical protein